MADLVVDTSARDAVRAFLAQGDGSDANDAESSSSEGLDDLLSAPRPARLGLGAKFLPHVPTPGSTAAERRLRGALRKERDADEDDADDAGAMSSEGERESRAGVLGKRKRKKAKKRSRKEGTEGGGNVAPGGGSGKDGTAEYTTSGNANVVSSGSHVEGIAASSVAQAAAPKSFSQANGSVEPNMPVSTKIKAYHRANTNAGRGGLQSDGHGWKPRKKKRKIRSRQKNLRRDTRPKESLPPHLTEETLHGGRVRREDRRGASGAGVSR